MPSRKLALVAPIALVAIVLTGCSSSSSPKAAAPGATTTASAGSDSAAVTAAKANAETFATVPTAIKQTKALGSAPPKGKKVGFVVCADPSCTVLVKYLKEAADALGWSVVSVNASATNPGAAIQQLIDAGVDYVAETGVDSNAFQSAYAQLKAKKIPLFECYGAADIPSGPTNGIYSNCFDTSAAKVYGPALADWVIADSNGSAHTLVMNLPAFPILTAQADAVQAEFKKSCPSCKTDALNLTVNDLTSGAVASNLTSYLQTHPDINYVYQTYEGFDAMGVAAAVKSLGGKKIKIVGEQAFQPEMQEIIDGTEHAWSELPEAMSMWTIIDQMARLSVGEWSADNERAQAVPPLFIVSTPEQAKTLVSHPHGWDGPDGYQAAYKKLWGV